MKALSSFERYLTIKRESIWEPIRPHCSVTKITNDSVYFIPLVCFALPLDTHWLFQCELASCCCSVWPHWLVRLFWYLLSSLSGSWPHQRIWRWIWATDSLWWVFLCFFNFKCKGLSIMTDNCWLELILSRWLCTGFSISAGRIYAWYHCLRWTLTLSMKDPSPRWGSSVIIWMIVVWSTDGTWQNIVW